MCNGIPNFVSYTDKSNNQKFAINLNINNFKFLGISKYKSNNASLSNNAISVNDGSELTHIIPSDPDYDAG